MNVKQTIDLLKQQGYAVKVRHERPILVPILGSRALTGPVVPEGDEVGFGTRHELDQVREHDPRAFFAMKGGVTTVEIMSDDQLAARGYAYCRPDDELGPGDQFNRKLGSRIALGRALKQLEEGR